MPLPPLPSISIAPRVQPRKRTRTRTLSRITLALAALATAGFFTAAHATYPGENGVIVFEAYERYENRILRVSPGNSEVTELGVGVEPSVSPNGKKIAFLSYDHSTLYVMNIDGSNVVQLANDQAFLLLSPAWLPDGSKIAFGRSLPNQVVELWTINPDGSDKTFKRNLGGFFEGLLDLAWSPSGNIYTYSGGDGLNIADDVTPGFRLLMPHGRASSWAPDGKSILFDSWMRDGLLEINPDGSNFKVLNLARSNNHPSAISPDGRFVAGRRSNGEILPKVWLETSERAPGTPTTFTWDIRYPLKTDWSRVPKNCYTSTPQGGGGVLAGDVDFYASQCAIVVMPDGGALNGVLQQAIAIGPDQRLYVRDLKAGPPGLPPIWSSFMRVPGVGGNPNGVNAKKIAIAAAKDGSAQVVIINANDNLVYHAMRYASGSWSGFTALDGWAGAANFAARDVAITINASTPTSPGNAQVIANGLNGGNIFHRVRWAAGNWTPFAGVPGLYANRQVSHELAIAADENGYTDILATMEGGGGAIRLLHQTRKSDSTWDGNWIIVGMPKEVTFSPSSDVAVTRTSKTAQLAFTDSAGNVFFQERANPNPPSSWQSEAPVKTIASAVGRGVSISAEFPEAPGATPKLLFTGTSPQ